MKPKTLLPSALLPLAGGGGPVSLRDGRGPRALVTLHAADCPGCVAYLATLRAAAADASAWDGRFLPVVPGPERGAGASPPAGEPLVLYDPQRLIADGRARVAVADEWGEVFFAAEAERGHDLPAAGELVDWMRFVAIQCPECENPEGEWRTLAP